VPLSNYNCVHAQIKINQNKIINHHCWHYGHGDDGCQHHYHDYDLRAKKFHDDELGLLSDAFNAMIIGIGSAQHDIDKANKQKSDFLAMMSHEIRTPINGIVGTADLLSETALTGRQRDYVEIIEKSAETLLDLINDILDFSKIEAEKLKIENVAFDITQHIQDVIDMLQVSTGQKGLRLYFTNNIQRALNKF